jgi:NAD(P)-dependent dehydrogenase (short-subunit alcohol dehydrogenase family)
VLVLGAQGVLGTVLARTFAEEGWTVVRAGRRPEADLRLVDLDRPKTLGDALDGVDLVANPVPDERLAAERVVVEHGPRIVEGRGDYRMTAAATVVFGDALVKLRANETRRTGVFAPEELFTLRQLQPAFERRGFRIVEPSS